MSLTVTVSTPCPGQQSLNQVIPTLYQGASGNFTLVVLSAHPTLAWLLVVYDYSDPNGPCYPSALFGQVTPNPSDPKGLYGKLVGGVPDTNAGSATVA